MWPFNKLFGDNEQEDSDSEYPKTVEKEHRVTCKFTRTSATVHYTDGRTENIEYDVRTEQGESVVLQTYDWPTEYDNRDFYVTIYRGFTASVKLSSPTGDEVTLSYANVEKIVKNHQTVYIAFADVEHKERWKSPMGGEIVSKPSQDDVDWTIVPECEYDQME